MGKEKTGEQLAHFAEVPRGVQISHRQFERLQFFASPHKFLRAAKLRERLKLLEIGRAQIKLCGHAMLRREFLAEH